MSHPALGDTGTTLQSLYSPHGQRGAPGRPPLVKNRSVDLTSPDSRKVALSPAALHALSPKPKEFKQGQNLDQARHGHSTNLSSNSFALLQRSQSLPTRGSAGNSLPVKGWPLVSTHNGGIKRSRSGQPLAETESLARSRIMKPAKSTQLLQQTPKAFKAKMIAPTVPLSPMLSQVYDLLKDLAKEDGIFILNDFCALTERNQAKRLREFENKALKLSLDEDAEMQRGRFLQILQATSR
mmetsp:Transcript_5206/g.7211  ORF Transcript_5206/g.7211 Transcript_5206/m.7211 type:complete len:239 (+) Transcript_5206:188-904(+)